MSEPTFPPLAVTMGEPAGVGGEIAIKAWRKRRRWNIPPFFAIDDPDHIGRAAEAVGGDVPIATIDDPSEAEAVYEAAFPVLPLALARREVAGKPNVENAEIVLESIRRAVALALDGKASGVVTSPIHKGVLYEAGFRNAGHTDFLAELCGNSAVPAMMLACPGLRTVPVSTHVSMRDALDRLTTERIVETARTTVAALIADFGIAEPRLMVAALNPHGGEDGTMGREEIDIIEPAVDILRAEKLQVRGPRAADSLFHASARNGYDAAICMFHDQALIPLKTVDFESGVNITIGLPIVRTSPDHGTALSLSGTGNANATSMILALSMASGIAMRRGSAGRK